MMMKSSRGLIVVLVAAMVACSAIAQPTEYMPTPTYPTYEDYGDYYGEDYDVPPGTEYPTTGVPCQMDMQQCASGAFVSRVSPSCEFAACPAMDCGASAFGADGAAPFVGCSGASYADACEADAASDFCADEVRLQGQAAVMKSCPDQCENFYVDICPLADTAADGTCIHGNVAAHNASAEESVVGVHNEVADIIDQVQRMGSNIVDHVVSRLEELSDDDVEISDLLRSAGREAARNVTSLVGEIAGIFADFDEEDIEAVVMNILGTDLGIDDQTLEENGVVLEDAIVESRQEVVDEIFVENDNQTVEATLRLTGDPMSPAVELVGPTRMVTFKQDNLTDYVRFGTKVIREVDQMGNVVQQAEISKIVERSPPSAVASDVNLGTPEDQKRAIEVILSYNVDPTTLGSCYNPANPAADTGQAQPTYLVRVYLIGDKAIEINYLGDDVLLHPYSLKYTIEVESWPFCSDQNTLEVVMDYKFSERAGNTRIEEIVDANIPRSSVTPEDASYESIMLQDMSNLENEMETLMEDLDLDEDEWEFDDEFEDWEEDWEDYDFNDRRRLQQAQPWGPGPGPWQNGLPFAKTTTTTTHHIGGMGAMFGMSNALDGEEIKDMIYDLDPEDRAHLLQVIRNLQNSGAAATNMGEKDLEVVEKLMARSRRRMLRKTRNRVRDELRDIRRERVTVAATMRMMRKRLAKMQRTFTEGKLVDGFGHTRMFMPQAALVGGAKRNVKIEVNENGLQNLEVTVTFPNCGDKCIWDPTIDMNDDANLVPTPPEDGDVLDVSAAFAGFGHVGTMLLGAVFLVLALV